MTSAILAVTILAALVVKIIETFSTNKNLPGQDKDAHFRYSAIVICILATVGILTIITDSKQVQSKREQVNRIQVEMRIRVNSDSFSAFNDNAEVREKLLKGTYKKWKQFDNSRKGINSFLQSDIDQMSDVSNLLKRKLIKGRIKEYIFDDLQMQFSITSENNKSYIQPDTISEFEPYYNFFVSTDFEIASNTYYYVIRMDHIVDIDDKGFMSLSGFDGATCEIRLKIPKEMKHQVEYLSVRLIGPDKHFLRDAYFKPTIVTDILSSRKHQTTHAQILIPKEYSGTYRREHKI
ncbi:MAG: hypothetical protein ACE1ZM_05070 [Gammaproteobacteria bacterium]